MGWTAGCEYAEAFVRARAETLPMISVAAADLRKSVESPQVEHARISGEFKESTSASPKL